MSKRAVLYARVCVDDKQNLAEQMEICRKWAQERGWHVVDELAERGSGSTSLGLPRLGRVLESAQSGGFDVLVVRDAYRLSRCLAKLLVLEQELAQQGVQIEYIWRSCAGASTGDLARSAHSALALVEGGSRTW